MHGVAAQVIDTTDQLPAPGETRASIRRQRLVEAARQLFAERGFHGAGMAQLASLSGVKVGQIYRDFASKEDLVAAIVEADLAKFLDEPALQAAVAESDRDAARNWIADLVLRKTEPHRAPLVPEIMAEAARNPRIADILAETDRRIRACVLAALSLFASAPGDSPRLNSAAELILTLMTGLCSRQVAFSGGVQGVCVQRIHTLIDGECGALMRGE